MVMSPSVKERFIASFQHALFLLICFYVFMKAILSNALGNMRRLNQYKKSNTESCNINGFIEWFIRLEKKKQEGLI